MIGDILQAIVRAGSAYAKTLIRVACVLAVAVASVSHVVADVASLGAGPSAVTVLQADADGCSDIGGTAERCHACAVVSFTVASQSVERDIVAGPIPDGRLLHLSSFQLPAIAPPPRALT